MVQAMDQGSIEGEMGVSSDRPESNVRSDYFARDCRKSDEWCE